MIILNMFTLRFIERVVLDPVQCEGIENQPSDFASCSDNGVHLLVLVAGMLYRGLQLTSLFLIRGCVFKGHFERGVF